MRALTGVMCGVVLAMSVGATQSVGNADDARCDVLESEVADLDAELLVELFDEMFEGDACEALRGAAEARLDALFAEGAWRSLDDPERIAYLALMVAEKSLQRSLTAGDDKAARERVQVVHDRRSVLVALTHADDELHDGASVAALQRQEFMRLERIKAILDGESLWFVGDRVAAPERDWTIFLGWCGTPALMFDQGAREMAGEPHALLATGRPELALQALLREQWVNAISLGMTPPLLREFAERAFGADAFEAEVANAVTGIELQVSPLGSEARIRLFGLDLPLPVAIQSWQEERSLRFTSRQALAEWIEPLLLSRRDHGDDDDDAAEASASSESPEPTEPRSS